MPDDIEEEDIEREKRKKEKSKHKKKTDKKKKKKKDGKKDKKKKKDGKKEKKKKKQKRSRKSSDQQSSSSSSSDSSDSEAQQRKAKRQKTIESSAPGLVEATQAPGPDAVKQALQLLASLLKADPESKEQLLFLVYKMDQGENITVDGIANELARDSLKKVFELVFMSRLKQGGVTSYTRGKGTPALLDAFMEFTKGEEQNAAAGSKLPVSTQKAASSSAPQAIGPSMPPPKASPTGPGIGPSAIGPTGPPIAPGSDEEEDGFGPKQPSKMTQEEKQELAALQQAREFAAWKLKQAELAPTHEEWMTELPPEMRLSSDPKDNMKKRTFSMKGMKKRGDTSQWTDTPAQRQAKRLEAMLKAQQREKDEIARMKNNGLHEDGRSSVNDSAEAAQAFHASSLGEANSNLGESEEEKKKRLFKEFKAARKAAKEERRERKKKLEEFYKEGVVWDREKMMEKGGAMNEKNKKQMMRKAQNIMSRFSVGDPVPGLGR